MANFKPKTKKFLKNFFTSSSNAKKTPDSMMNQVDLIVLYAQKCKKSPYITFCGDIRANFNYLKIAHFTEYISEEIPQKPCVYASFMFWVKSQHHFSGH